MGKLEAKKQNKRSSLLANAYSLFAERGFNKTTVSDIVKEAGMAKGTFYLYFKDKYDLRDQLVARMSAQLLLETERALKNRPDPLLTMEDYLLAFVDYILNYFRRNKIMLNFISKNLSWGIFKHAVEKTENRGNTEEEEGLGDVYTNFLSALELNGYSCSSPELLLFTIIELVNATGYSTIMYESPCSLDDYLPYLHKSIHQILEGYRTEPKPAESRIPEEM